MEYLDLNDMPYRKECEPIAERFKCRVVSIRLERGKVCAVITPMEGALGVDECAEVHHALLPKLEVLLGTDNLAMELSSPGERHIKNAAEFALFPGRGVRLFVRRKSDGLNGESGGQWLSGKILNADKKDAVVILAGEKEETVLFSEIVKAQLTSFGVSGKKGEAYE